MSDTAAGLTDENFVAAIAAATKPILVCFMSSFCGPSHALFPMLDSVLEQTGAEFSYAEVDVERCPVMTRTFEVKGTPMLIWFHNGEPSGSRAGSMSQEYLWAFVADMQKRSAA